MTMLIHPNQHPTLNSDILYNILNILIPCTPIDSLNEEYVPLDILRRISHVCHDWRRICLQSATIWGRCIDLGLMQQEEDHWRNLVLQRSGQHTLLFVTGSKNTPISAESGVSEFLMRVLHSNWERIQLLDVLVEPSIIDNPRFRTALNRPSTILHTLAIHTKSAARTLNPSTTPMFILSPGNLPNLAHLSLSLRHAASVFPLTIHVQQTPSFSTKLQRLVLLNPELSLTDVELLTACSQMPLLESLHMQIPELILTTPPYTEPFCRPNMPYLDTIIITAVSLDIYAAFLDHITPRAGCALQIFHRLEHKYSSRTAATIEAMDIVQRVIKHYAASYFTRHAGEAHLAHFVDIIVVIYESIEFCFDSLEHSFMVHLPIVRYMDSEFLVQLLDTVLCLHFPSSVEVLQLYLPPGFTNHARFNDHPPAQQVMRAIPSITTLKTTLATISFLGDIVANEDPFPRLRKIAFIGVKDFPKSVRESILPFLQHKYSTSPITTVDFSKYGVEVLGDLRCLDKLSGLKVVWKSKISRRPNAYVCGTGGKEKLLFN